MPNDFEITDAGSNSASQRQVQHDRDYQLSENVVEDIVMYSRSRIVKNEEQFVITFLGYLSGYMESPKHYNSGVLIGTAGAGKSHLQNVLEDLYPEEDLYQTTSGSEKNLIYDDTWDDAKVASLDELQKPGQEIIEVLKSLHGGEDEKFVYKVTGGGRGADRDVDEIVKEAKPYWFLYAQYEPDFEMWDRLLKVPVHESKHKNRGVLATKWDHANISFDDADHEYMFDFIDGRRVLESHIETIPDDAWVKIPAGEDEFGWNAIEHAEPIFDISRSETNRVGAMVANLVRASALLNYKNREQRKIHVSNEGVKRAYIAEPQDLANVLAARETLMATTHQLDRKKKAVCVAIEEMSDTRNSAPIDEIQEHLRKTNASFVKRSEIEHMLDDLIDNHLVTKLDRAGEGGKNLYKFQGWQNLGKFEINDEFERVFDGVMDPIRGQPFIETARELNRELEPSVKDFMKETSVRTGKDGQATLESMSDGKTKSVSVKLAPHEEVVRKRLYETVNGTVIDNLDEREPSDKELLGVVPLGEDGDGRVDGTIFDPNHDVWSHGVVEVDTQAQAASAIEDALRRLAEEDIFTTSTLATTEYGEPQKMRVEVLSDEQIDSE